MNIEELAAAQNPWWEDPNARAGRLFPDRRDLQPRLREHLLQLDDRRAVAIVGPRQVGKTVMLRQVIDDLLDQDLPPANITYFDFSDARLTEEILPNAVADVTPSGVVEELPRILLFDEISRAINWDLWLKNVVDRGGFRVAVTDSAATLLRSGTRESGQGRWIELQIEGLTLGEALRLVSREGEELSETLRRAPGLFGQYLAVGGYPAYQQVPDHRIVWEELREELVNRAIVRDLLRSGVDVERARNLFVFLVRESGAIFKVGERARQLDADPRSVHDWLRLLEEAGLISRLPRFATRPSRRLQSDPRFHASDHGLIWALSLTPSQDPAVRGKVFEAVVFRHLREILRGREGSLSYFRQRNDLEIDFVLDLPSERVAIEVTSSHRVDAKRIERVARASSELGADRTLVVFGGPVDSERQEVRVLPVVDFLLDPGGSLELEVS